MARHVSVKEAFVFLGLILLVLIVWLISKQQPEPFPERPETDETEALEMSNSLPDVASWNTYQSNLYNFSLRYPPSWQLAAETGESIPIITVYKSGEAGSVGVLDHFEDRTHVSVYPRGVPTEGVFSRRIDSRVSMVHPTSLANDLVLATGEPWASEYRFSTMPDSWGPAGFVWARNKISGMSQVCMRSTSTIPDKECDPLFGDELVRSGDLVGEDRTTIEAILRSFRFIDDSSTPSGNASDFDLVLLAQPQEGSRIRDPLIIKGKARGHWFFEGSFTATLLDANGQILAEDAVLATDNWMSDSYVEFYAELTYPKPETVAGTLILEKANPSGLPEHAAKRAIPVVF